MLKWIYYIVGIVLATILHTSCTDYSQITITNVKDLKISPSSSGKFKITLSATIKNPTRRSVKLRSAAFDVQQKGMAFAALTLSESFTITRRSENDYPIVLEAKLQNVLALLGGLTNFSANDFSVDGAIKVCAFPLYTTIRFKRQSLKEFERQFGNIFSSMLNN